MEYGKAYYLPEDYIKANIYEARLGFRDYKYFGAHFIEYGVVRGVSFMVFAPNAVSISLVGEFNSWNGMDYLMKKLGDTGIWHIFICGLEEMQLYKYEIRDRDDRVTLKSDPYGFYSEIRPNTASICVELNRYRWNDEKWIKRDICKSKQVDTINIYELHMGSWRRKADGSFYNYKEIANELLEHVLSMGYTHIELMPLMEHPFDGSWGYQVTGYFSITSRYGTPEDFMYFVDRCHQKGIGVILDWVPVHFCRDEHGLVKFDGSSLYEYDNPIMAENVQWGTISFDHSKPEVVRFLISNALFWLDLYHIDGLRVDAVTYMLYLDAGRPTDKWLPNEYGGRENLHAVDFLRQLNKAVHQLYPNALMIAEESSAWPKVTGSIDNGGLDFDYKWNMGWMNDVLRYMEMDPIYRKWHHHLVCFSFVYAFDEKFILALSHDEVVHGKKSLLDKMPGDYWSKFANLRALYGYMTGHMGKKLLFMGGEFGQFIEWNENKELDWMLLDFGSHRMLKLYVKEINDFYKKESSLHELDNNPSGFEWIDSSNSDESVIVFMRKAVNPKDFMIIVCNFTPVVRESYRVGVPMLGIYQEVFNSDLERYGGTGITNGNSIMAESQPWNNQSNHIAINIPPLSAVFIKFKANDENRT